jgi:hypothetical protein
MTVVEIFLVLVGGFVVLPVLAYMVMKFGAAGYFRAKNKQQEQNRKETCQDRTE